MKYHVISDIVHFIKSNTILLLSELIDNFTKSPYSWSTTAYDINKYILSSHLNFKSLPINPTSRALHIGRINQGWNWRIKNNLVENTQIIPVDTKVESKLRTYK